MRQDNQRLGCGKARTYANARTDAKGDILETVLLRLVFRREPLMVKAVGFVPKLAVAMHYPRLDKNQLTLFHLHAEHIVVRNCFADQLQRRGIKPHRFVQYLT